MLKMTIVLQQSLAAQIAVWTRRGRRSRRFGIWALLNMAITLTTACTFRRVKGRGRAFRFAIGQPFC